MTRVLGLVPARAGSKRLPGKNLLPFRGRPLVAHAAVTAASCSALHRVVVSTDSEAIREACVACGVEVPFLRPDALASDTATSVDVALHALDALRASGWDPDVLVLLQPTSPLRTATHVQQALDLFQRHGGMPVVSVRATHPPSWTRSMRPDGALVGLGLDDRGAGGFWVPNGAVYVVSAAHLREHRSFSLPSAIGYPMTQADSIDVDTDEDFRLAALIASHHP